MKNNINLSNLDIQQFAHARAHASGTLPVDALVRLRSEDVRSKDMHSPPLVDCVNWELRGDEITTAQNNPQTWLHLRAQTTIQLTCQRCLNPVSTALDVLRHFRFVANEQLAMQEDDENEEDVLVLSKKFNTLELIEDELLMSIPLVPRHEACKNTYLTAVNAQSLDNPDFQKPNPFMALKGLKNQTKQ